MNCKQGDLAVVVGAVNVKKNIGLIVEVLRLAVNGNPVGKGLISGSNAEPAWVIRKAGGGSITAWSVSEVSFQCTEAVCLDRYLRPIRPQDDDAEDESKAWLPPVPTKEHA